MEPNSNTDSQQITNDIGLITEKKLSEKRIAKVLDYHLTSLGYKVITEFVLNDVFLDISKLTRKKISKTRIDVAALKDGKLLFIEVENGLWMTHPIQYRNLAHKVFLAYPAEAESLTDDKQLEMAKKFGIGVLKVSSIGTIITVVKPKEKLLDPKIEKTIEALFNKRFTEIKN